MADVYKKLTVMYDNLFEVSFPYSAGIHQAPTDGMIILNGICICIFTRHYCGQLP
jgi:galactose-1-phosphate uridylyltransferase